MTVSGKQRVWVLSELYYPEETSTGHFLTGIAEGLSQNYEVMVLCSQPTYSVRGTRAPKRELHKGVKIRRCAGTTLNKDFLPFRLMNLITISLSMFCISVAKIRKNDCVLVVTNPAALPFLVSVACRLRRARCLLLIHDVYPEALIAAGMTRADSPLAWGIGRLTRWLYRHVECIIVLGRDMKQLVQSKLGVDQKRVVLIPNWGDLDGLKPEPRGENQLLCRLGLSEKFVVQYCGNMGRTHGLECLIESAARLSHHERIHFLFIGWGAKKLWLDQKVLQDRINNVSVLPSPRRSGLSETLNACDVSIISMMPGMAGVSVPSRVYDVLAAGKPVIAVTDAHSELALIVREERIGWVVPPGHPDQIVDTILEAHSNPGMLAEMSRRAHAAAEDKYSYPQAIQAYCSLVASLVAPGSG